MGSVQLLVSLKLTDCGASSPCAIDCECGLLSGVKSEFRECLNLAGPEPCATLVVDDTTEEVTLFTLWGCDVPNLS